MRIAVVLVAMFVTILTTHGQVPTANQAEANRIVVRRAFQALEQRDLKTLNEVFDPNGPIHTPQGKVMLQGGPFTDLKGSCPMCAALANRQIKIDLMLAEGDLVAVRSTWSGKYSGNIRGVLVADRDVSVVYTNIYRVAGGKIVENWYEVDSLSLAEQLGMKLVPAEAGK